MNFTGSENIIDDPVMVNGKFVRNVGQVRTPAIYHYVYMKDSDKDLFKRFELATKVGLLLGVSVGAFHIASYGRAYRWRNKWAPVLKMGFSAANGVMVMALHTGTASVCSQLQGNRDLVRNWVLAGAVSSAYAMRSIDMSTEFRRALGLRVMVGATLLSGFVKFCVLYDKPMNFRPVTSYGCGAYSRHQFINQTDAMNQYRRQEEMLLEKFL